MISALRRFGAPLHDVSTADFETPGGILHIGIAPNRIDLTSAVDGVTFDECRPRALEVSIDDLKIPVISREDLVANKRATARPQDLLDADVLDDG